MLSTFLTFIAMSAPAHAVAYATSPGSNCAAVYGGWSNQYNGGGRANNSSSTSTLILDCPMSHDWSYTNIDGAVYVIDQHFSSNISCTFVNIYGSTSSASFYGGSSTVSSSGSNATPQALSFSAVSAGSLNTYNLRYCSLPATYSGYKSGVASYYVYEY